MLLSGGGALLLGALSLRYCAKTGPQPIILYTASHSPSLHIRTFLLPANFESSLYLLDINYVIHYIHTCSDIPRMLPLQLVYLCETLCDQQ